MLKRLQRIICLTFLIWILCLAQAFSENENFVETRDIEFYLNDKPFHFIGTNCYYLMVYAADQNLRHHVDKVLEDAAAMGIKVVRTWAFNDGEDQWNALQTAPGEYQENVFYGLDYVLEKANSLNLRLILPLVNNWDDYGGMNQYVDWSSTATEHDDFYTDANTKQWYKNHIQTVLNRENTINGRIYKQDPTIFSWELANEPRCSSDASGQMLNNWISEMSAYIKSIDPSHLLSIGCEGFYNENNPLNWMNNQGTDYLSDHQISDIDFVVAHSWPDHWGWGKNKSGTLSFLQQQITDAHNVIGKPFVLEEFGKYRDTDPPIPNPAVPTGGSGNTDTRDEFYESYYDKIYDNSAGSAMNWILYHDEYPDYDGFGVYYPADQTTVEIIENAVNQMEKLDNPISIGISSLSAAVDDSQIILEWLYQTPGGVAGFYIQRASNNDTHFIRLNPDSLLLNCSTAADDKFKYIDYPKAMGIYVYRIEILYLDGRREFSAPVTINFNSQKGVNSPEQLFLSPNYPNPFNSLTTIHFQTPNHSQVKASIFDVRGQKICTLINADIPAGAHVLTWNGTDKTGKAVGSGVYILEIKCGKIEKTIKLDLLR